MTKKGYAEVRDIFTSAQKALDESTQVFLDLVDYDLVDNETNGVSEWDISRALDDAGSWLTGSEYSDVQAAIALFEKLTGRAHLRAT